MAMGMAGGMGAAITLKIKVKKVADSRFAFPEVLGMHFQPFSLIFTPRCHNKSFLLFFLIRWLGGLFRRMLGSVWRMVLWGWI